MSSTSFDVSELSRTAGKIRALAAEAKVASLATTIGLVMNKSWGSDAIGVAFAEVYQPAAQEVMRNVLDAAPHLGEIAAKLKASADSYAATEESNTQQATTAQQAPTTQQASGRPDAPGVDA